MGVVNVTPDSFSDGGRWFGAHAAIKHGLDLVAQGADIVDVGGESTRPGAQRVSPEEELRRIGPVVTELVKAGVPTSIDTMRAPVAEFALDAGVQLVNDVSGGLADPQLPRLVAAAGAGYVVVHWRGHSQDMYARAVYADVVGEVRDELRHRIDAIVAAGVDPDRIVVDPGLGFGKRPEHNWPLLTHLADVGQLGGRTFPVLVGASRKGIPGSAAGRPGRDAAAVRRPRRGHRGDLGAGRGGRGVVRPRARGASQRRRGTGGGRVARRRSVDDAPGRAMTGRARAVLSVGANLGNRLGTLQGCVQAIARLPDTDVLAISPVYETAPVGGPAQPDYLNAVLVVETGLPPRALLEATHRIEADFGRVRAERFGPRTLDVDLISYGGRISDDPVATLPHPRAHERAFVLAPWHDIDPGAELPGWGAVADLLAGLDRTGVRPVPGALLGAPTS